MNTIESLVYWYTCAGIITAVLLWKPKKPKWAIIGGLLWPVVAIMVLTQIKFKK